MTSTSKPVIFPLLLATVFLGWSLQPLPVLAGPPVPVTFTITQPDGTTFVARAWGDEHSNGLETVDGYTVLQDSGSSYWFYAQVDDTSGHLKVTNKIAGKDNPPVSARGARPTVIGIHAQDKIVSQGPVGAPSVPILVLLVQYANRPAISTEADWLSTFLGAANSVEDYYQEISYHQFDLTPALETCGSAANDGVTGWMTLGSTHPNAGGPSIAHAALDAADSCVNYAAFDDNSDGRITSNELLPIIIVAGYEKSYGGPTALSPNVWGQQSTVNHRSASDDVTIVPFGQFGEWHAATWDNPGHRATIGVMVHEIGHLLGWPDLYDPSPPGNPDSEGLGDWSVMGSGLWLGTIYTGDTPAHPSAWEKWYQGWLTPLQLQGINLTRSIPRVEDNQNNSVIQLRDNPNGVDWSFDEFSGSGEYFLVENRQKIGYDAQLPGCGLLIWHIDESVTFNNWANADENHKLVDLEEADGLNHLDSMTNRGDAGDPYPGSSYHITFNSFSTPNSRLYDNRISGVSISNISPGCADTKTATFTTVAIPNLTISITPDPTPIEATTTMITYTLMINNNGDANATTVTITNTIPVSTTYLVASASDGGAETAPGSGVITWPPTTIAISSAITRTFQVTVSATLTNGDKLTNFVSVSSAQGINLENLAQVETVGIRSVYFPIILNHK